ncbi:MAG: 50S ribosomal protein L6 [Holosporaceae bacterium]|jgi:large subunit ribosomal protein L6|nr:50S ribosomal protein L6 [Holosporaceae bacterium]
MSRVGKHPIVIPGGVNVSLEGGMLTGTGKNGEFLFRVHNTVNAEVVDGKVCFSPKDSGKGARAMWGTSRSIVSKGLLGLAKPFSKKINLVGVGYKASVQGRNIVLQLGYSHDVVFEIPGDIKIVCESPTAIVVSGANVQRVGETVKCLQKFRDPEPYKGKGVIIEGQFVYRKEGKKK